LDIVLIPLNNDVMKIKAILVPRGAEYQSVLRGVKQGSRRFGRKVGIPVIPVPMGQEAIGCFLVNAKKHQASWTQTDGSVIMMGLCGALSPTLTIGDTVIYQSCWDGGNHPRSCDPSLTHYLHHHLDHQTQFVIGWTSDRLIHDVGSKQSLHLATGASVVDMEGWTSLEVLQSWGKSVAMVRVVSDDAHHSLPELKDAIGTNGELLPLPLAIGLLRQPIPGLRLIRGSWIGLTQLTAIAHQLALLQQVA